MSRINVSNMLAYIQGNYRYKLYYSRFKWLLRPHIVEQIDVRINSMDRQCYNEGQCKLCGCKTTALQMANKACEKPCYPKMIDKVTWTRVKNSSLGVRGNTIREGENVFGYDREEKKFVKLAVYYE